MEVLDIVFVYRKVCESVIDVSTLFLNCTQKVVRSPIY